MRIAGPTYYVTALLICLMGLCAIGATAQEDDIGDRRIRIDALGISLRLPADWRLQMLDGQAARLVPSMELPRKLALQDPAAGQQIKLWPIEIVVWTTPAPHCSAQQAVAGHEQLLKQHYHYQRKSSEPFTSAFGLSGIAVTGEIGTGEDTLLAIFAGYAVLDRNIIVGTFCRPAVQEVVARLFWPLIWSVGPVGAADSDTPSPLSTSTSSPQTDRRESARSLEQPPSATQPPTTASAESPIKPHRMSAPQQVASQPQTDRAPSTPTPLRMPQPSAAAQRPTTKASSEAATVHPPPPIEPIPTPSHPTEPQQEPATPPSEAVRPSQWTEHILPVGVTLQTPAGWSVVVQNGVLHAHNTQPACGIMVCPLFVLPSVTNAASRTEKDADIICHYWQQLIACSFTATSHLRVQRSGQAFDVLSGTLTLGDNIVRTIISIAADEPIILLTAAYAPPEQFEQRLPELQRILTGLSWPRLTPTIPGQLSGRTITWTSSDGRLSGQAPEGWQIRADISQYNGHTVVTVDGYCEEHPHLLFGWHQPYTPFFRELTPLLRGLGRLSGEPYRDSSHEAPLTILSKLSPLEFVTQKLLDDIDLRPQDIEMQRASPCDQVKSLVEGRDQTGTIIQITGRCPTGTITAEYLLAMADLPVIEGSFRWKTAYLMWSGIDGLSWAAHRALCTVLRTARNTRATPAEDDLTEMVEAARSALDNAAPEQSYELLPLLSEAFRPQAAGPVAVPKLLWAYWADSD